MTSCMPPSVMRSCWNEPLTCTSKPCAANSASLASASKRYGAWVTGFKRGKRLLSTLIASAGPRAGGVSPLLRGQIQLMPCNNRGLTPPARPVSLLLAQPRRLDVASGPFKECREIGDIGVAAVVLSPGQLAADERIDSRHGIGQVIAGRTKILVAE